MHAQVTFCKAHRGFYIQGMFCAYHSRKFVACRKEFHQATLVELIHPAW